MAMATRLQLDVSIEDTHTRNQVRVFKISLAPA